MTVASGVLDARFRKRSAQIRRFEVWIVAEAAAASRILEHAAFNLSAPHLFAQMVPERGNADILGAVTESLLIALSSRGHPRDELGVVRRVQRLTVEILAARPSLAVDTGLSTQHVDAHPRVVAKSWQAARDVKEVSRLGQRILLEGLVAFQLVFRQGFQNAESRYVSDLETKLVEDLA